MGYPLLLFGNRNKPTVNWSFLGSLPSGMTFSRASSGAYFNSAGIMVSAADNDPRFDYDPVTLEPRGLLLEEQRTNLAFPGTAITGVWSSVGTASIVSNASLSPEGISNASAVTENTSLSQHNFAAPAVAFTSGTTYAFSTFLKAGTSSIAQMSVGIAAFASCYVNFDLASGTISSSGGTLVGSGISNAGGGWYRCWFAATATASSSTGAAVYQTNNNPTATRAPSYIGTGLTLHQYGYQIEVGSFPTSYILTSGSTVTRAADALYTTSISWLNATQGTFIAQFIAAYSGAQEMNWVGFSDGTFNNQLGMLQSTANYEQFLIRNAGTGNGTAVNSALNPAGSINKMGVSYNSSNYLISANGAAAASASVSSGLPSTISKLSLGSRGDGNLPASGWLQSFKYWNRALTATELQQVTK